MAHCEEIADRLYHRYGVRNVLLEGLSKSFVDQYNRIPLQRRSIIGDNNAGMIVHRTWTRLLAEKAWVLLPASDRELVGPLTALGREYEARIVAALDKAKTEGWLRNREVYETNKPKLEAQLKAIAGEYNAKHRALLEEDPGLKREYDITVTQRNKAFLDHLLAAKRTRCRLLRRGSLAGPGETTRGTEGFLRGRGARGNVLAAENKGRCRHLRRHAGPWRQPQGMRTESGRRHQRPPHHPDRVSRET